jgi:peptidyl-prolyl cis-trans isomerase D
MKVISTIQKRAYIIFGIIAFCIIAFLYQDISPSVNSLSASDNYIGKVNGETLSYDEYKKEYDKMETEMKLQKGGQTLTEDESTQLRNQIFSNFLKKNTISKILTKLGIGISDKEILEITRGQNIDPAFMQIPAFKNQMGQFDPMLFDNFLKTINQDEPGTPPGTRKRQWEAFAEEVLENRKVNKFTKLIENALYVPKWQSDFDIKLFGTSCDIKYVAVPYSSVDIDKIKVEKSELEDYFKKNKFKYTANVPTAKIAVASFDLKPSFADSVEIFNKFNARIEEMRTATNDTAFFRAYGDNGGYNTTFYSPEQLGEHPKNSEMYAAAPRTIIGPYIDKNDVKAFRILAKKNIADSVLVKTITISFQDVKTQEGQMQRYKLIDSIFKMVDTLNMDFDQIASKYSADRGQTPPSWIARADKSNNPEIFWHGATTKHFKTVAEREGAIKIAKVLNFQARTPAIQLGEISTPYVPSNETQQATLSKAMQYIQKCTNAKHLEKVAKTNPDVKFKETFISKESATLEGLEGNPKEVIRWAFNAKTGDVSSMIQVGNNYVYCGHLGSRSRDGIKMEDVEEEILPVVKNEKAFKMIAAKMDGKSLEEIASKNKVSVDTLMNFGFSRSTIGTMPEPGVVTVASGLKPNQMSKPIKGTGSVFRIINTKINPSNMTPAEELQSKTQLNQGFKQVRGLFEAILSRFELDDNRINVF